MKYSNDEEGAVLILTLILLAVSIIFITAMNGIIYNDINRFESDKKLERAKQLARAGLEEKINQLETGNITLGLQNSSFSDGTYNTEVKFNNSGQLVIASQGIVEDKNNSLSIIEKVPTNMIDYNNFVVFSGWSDANASPEEVSFEFSGGSSNDSWDYFGVTAGNSENATKYWKYEKNNKSLHTKQSPPGISGMYNVDNSVSSDFELSIDLEYDGTQPGFMGVVFNYQNEDNYYFVKFEDANDSNYKLILGEQNSGTIAWEELGVNFDLATEKKLKVEFRGNKIKVYVDETLQLEKNVSTPKDGSFGVMAKELEDAYFKNLQVTLGANSEDVGIEDDTAVNNQVLELTKIEENYEGIQHKYNPQKIYYIKARFKQEDAPNGSNGQDCLLGVKGLDDLGNESDYIIEQKELNADWQVLAGYFTGTTDYNSEVSQLNPQFLDPSTKYFKPFFNIKNNDNGRVRIDYLKIERLEVNKN